MIKKEIDSLVLDTSNFTIVGEKPIAHGGHAQIYLVKDAEGNEYVAKVGNEDFLNNKEEKNFIRELLILSKVNNSCTVGIKGFSLNPRFKGDGETFDTENDGKDRRKIKYPTLILEKAAGGSIRTKLVQSLEKKADPKWTPTKRMINLVGIAFGMKCLHARRIIHRDLKPDNVLLNEQLHPKITDFGLSKIQYDNQQSISEEGTAYYMAPEIILGESNFTNSVDVYAFAILAYEVITLQKLYPKIRNVFQLMNEIPKGIRPKFPDDTNPKLVELVTRCWDHQDTARPTFEEIFELLKNPEYLIDGVDIDEYNEYTNSLEDDVKSLCLSPEVKSIVDQADKGDTEKMLRAANGFYDGNGEFPFNQDEALHYYRTYSFAMSSQNDETEDKKLIKETEDKSSTKEMDDESLIQELPSELKDIINEKKTPDELFELAQLFRTGKKPFPKNYQLSSYFSMKAFEKLQKDSKGSNAHEEEEEETSSEETQLTTAKEVNYVPLCTQALISQLPYINILLYGQEAAFSPIYDALTSQQALDHVDCEDEKFEIKRLRGRSIKLIYPKNRDDITPDEVLHFIRNRKSESNIADRIFMCLYCISPSLEHDSNDAHIINNFSHLVYTTIFVASVEKKSVIDKLKKKIKGKVYRRERMYSFKRLKNSTLIFDIKLYPDNSHSNLVQEFVDIIPNLSII